MDIQTLGFLVGVIGAPLGYIVYNLQAQDQRLDLLSVAIGRIEEKLNAHAIQSANRINALNEQREADRELFTEKLNLLWNAFQQLSEHVHSDRFLR